MPLALVTDTLYLAGTPTEPTSHLGRVASLGFDGYENLHVLDTERYRVATWNNRGEMVRTVGGHGDGPHEFRVPRFAHVLADGTLVVGDIAHRSLQIFSTEGEYLRSVGLPRAAYGPVPGDRAVLAGNGLIGPDDHWMPRRSESEPIPLFSFSLANDTLESKLHYEAWGPPFEQRTWGLTPRVHVAGFPDGRVAVSDSVAYRVKIISSSGTIDNVIERPLRPLPVTGIAMEAERGRQRDRVTERDVIRGLNDITAVVGISVPAVNVRQVVEDYHTTLDDMRFALEIPVIHSINVDWGDRIWITRTDATGGPGSIDIVEADGQYVGTVRPDDLGTPDAFGPNGLLAYIQENELGAQSVLVVRTSSIAFIAER